MKRIVTIIAVLSLAAAAAQASYIINTKHNLSSAGTQNIKGLAATSASADQVCVYCHTPHNATVAVPLWNRTASPNTYVMYRSSGLTAPANASAITADSVSGQCMSCHDGTVAEVGSRVVRPGPITMNGGVWNGGGLNNNLDNDHPIGFSYTAAQAIDTDLLVSTSARFIAGNITLFGTTSAMECGSCHMVHDNTNTPFLRSTNTNSQLCLACHNK